MKAFKSHTGLVGPVNRANVDTDIIIPKQYLKSIKRSGFGRYAFDAIRYLDEGWLDKPEEERQPNPDFELNHDRYQGASILITRDNFGCGSSREHAPWALDDYGFRAIIAPSYADIFYNNCFKNGLLPLVLAADVVDQLFNETYANEGYELSVDLEAQRVTSPSGESWGFEIDEFRKHCLLNGLDEIGLTLQDANTIKAYEEKRAQSEPWLFNIIGQDKI